MQLPLRYISIIFFLAFLKVDAQEIYIDSLERVLLNKERTAEEQVEIYCKLARANFESDLPLSFQQARKALFIGKKLSDGGANAFAYATLIHLYVQQKDMPQAFACRDSAQYYAGKTKNPIAKGFVWFRSGWLDLINDENDQSIAKLLKALNYFKGQQAFEYESLVYHYLASFYGYGNDIVKQRYYAQLCYQLAKESKQVDALNTAYYSLGQSYFDRFKLDTIAHTLLDSALLFYKKAMRLADEQPGRLLIRSNTAGIALNTANSYFQFFPVSYRDSVDKYIAIAMGIATKTNLQEVLLNGYGLKSEYALRDGNYNQAELLLLEGLASIEESVVKMPVTKARIFLALSRIAEKKGDKDAVIKYLREFIDYNKQAFDEEKLYSLQKVEAQYQSEKKEQKIAYLQQQAAFNSKRNILYVILGLTGIAVLLLLLSSYNYKLKASIRRQKLIDKEKQAAELKAKLREAEAMQLHTEQALLRERQERLEKEVLAGNLLVEEKNELLERLPTKVLPASDLSLDEQIKRIVRQQKKMDKDFEEHKADFFDMSPVFVERLQAKAKNNLTRLDLKYCSYILLGMSNKDISVRLNVEPKSIRMARYRIKQKLGLEKEQSLDNFIQMQK